MVKTLYSILHRSLDLTDFGVVIGKAFVNGRYINTKLGKVHYSKTGTHVVPYIKKEMKK
ncbi:hypothetical protein FAF35_05330 [Staphylococcus haemolyticus]|uniref:Bacterial toxin 50 domain-containing protein n=1 Tax=Staphylococcus haemolyticus TaxID=1283 RepID=A0A7Z1N702_STAHA|nr:polymorphic toxin type 50 domain-containing protein [Staphylococcus haemolyticus]MBK3923370.1 hypothetical protein [Staphylococcus haemolyticus]MBK3947810.1 hypothetical protein [Staphylococcus haemolyticus]PPJ76706.1 hypothetical protein CV019_02675 [Staphylococcus haemolyticus]TJX21462.1 hypothetical protein FAF23_11300 [Staphylococcus haemolyticus]TJX30148.1 hypothetical protein FAF24_03740 [Staphylococcus haemolyticus]